MRANHPRLCCGVFSELGTQRYEAASTIFGQYTLHAYQQQYSSLTQHLFDGTQPPQGPPIPNYLGDVGYTLPDPEGDAADINPLTDFGPDIGEVIIQTDALYRQGSVAMATFIAGNPRNDAFRMRDETFLTVEKKLTDDNWEVVYNDADFCTRFLWDRATTNPGTDGTVSHATVWWNIPIDQELGIYRLGHQGYRKDPVKGDVFCYGLVYSDEFEVVAADYRDRLPSLPI